VAANVPFLVWILPVADPACKGETFVDGYWFFIEK
jgi:hypothetical protein